MERDRNPFFLLAESSPDAIYIGSAGRFAYVNPAAMKLFGATSAEQLLGTPVIERIHPDHREIVGERIRRLHEQEESAPLLEETYLRLDGSPVEVEVAAVPFGHDGENAGLVFVRDISKRKRAQDEVRALNARLEQRVEERTAELAAANRQFQALNAELEHRVEERTRALDESRAHLQVLFDYAPAACVVWEAGYRVVEWNRMAETIFGWRREEVLGHNFFDFMVPPEAAAQVQAVVDGTIDSRIPTHSIDRNLTKSGRLVTCEWYNAVLNDAGGHACRVISMCTDISERQRAEEDIRELNRVLEQRVGERTSELQSKKEQLREALILNGNILRTTTAGILAYRPDGQCVLANPAAAALIGGGQDELLRQNFRRIASWRDSGLLAAAEHALAGGGRVQMEARFTSTFGRELRVDAHFSTFVSGEQAHLLLMLQDITEKKKAAAEIERLNADLERRVEERTAELALANDALLRSNLDLQHFAHVTAHDLQTPLRAIAGFAHLLRQEFTGKGGERADHWIEEVVLNTKRMHSLIADLMAYSRLDAQSRPMEATDFRRLVDEVLATLAPLVAETGAEVSCGELPTLFAERTQMAQVLQNLIDNAIKYNDSTPPQVRVSAELQDNEWVFSVADNGIGVDPKYHHRIFEIFRRLHTYREYPGNGIGLAVCRRVVERHGGLIWVESQAGKGSVFHFTIPAAKL